MGYLLTCECGREHTVTRSQAGQVIPCVCGQSIRVPTLRGLSKLPLAPDPSASAGTSTSRSAWAGWRGPTLSLTTAIFMIATAACLWFSLQRYMIDTSYTTETEIAAGNELFDVYAPEELSLVWNDYEKFGLGRKTRPQFYLWERYAKQRQRYAVTSGSIAAFFGLLSIGIWLSARLKAAQ